MAGNFPDAPAYRIPYDVDGSVLVTLNASAASPVVRTSAERASLNDESGSGFLITGQGNQGGSTQWFGLVLAEYWDLVGYFVDSPSSAAPGSWATSSDSTNGQDGTWTTRGGFTSAETTQNRRTAIQPVSIGNVKAVRFQVNAYIYNAQYTLSLHLYGNRTVGASVDRVRLWHPTLDQPVGPAYFDWGNRPRSSAATKQFRVKNTSSALTASGVLVSAEALTDATPTVVSQTSFSLNGGPFGGTQLLDPLPPGATSPILTVKQNLGADASLGTWAQRYFARVGSWA